MHPDESQSDRYHRIRQFGPRTFDEVQYFDRLLLASIQRLMSASAKEIDECHKEWSELMLHMYRRRDLIDNEIRRIEYNVVPRIIIGEPKCPT